MKESPNAYFKPDYAHWKQFEVLEIWQAAAMMVDVDPRRMPDITDRCGDPLDLGTEQQMLVSAVLAGSLVAAPEVRTPGASTTVIVASLVPWLRERGYDEMANGLDDPSAGGPSGVRWTKTRLAELDEFRERHGTKEAARKFGISTARVRDLLPRGKTEQPISLDNVWKAPTRK